MIEVLTLLLGAVLVHNPVVVSALGLSPAVVLARRLEVATGMARVSLVVVPLLALLAFLLDRAFDLPPGLAALRVLLLFPLIAALLLAGRSLLLRLHPRWEPRYGVYLPLFAVGSLAPGCVLLTLERAGGAGEALVTGLGLGAGYALVQLLLAGVHLRIAPAAVPASLRGGPVVILSLALLMMAFGGMVRPP
ncbi:MAG: hypothetical protein D6786_08675 [Gammaproteobacteria bacterium]|nr:MAG: hypothetical protein D6786_08675 [Gammaproteobacteria bacterium]